MSYDSSRGRPPRQARWPHATPQEGWPAYAGGEGRRDGRGAAGADPGWGAAAADPGWPGRDGYTGAAGYPDGGTGWAYGPAGYLDQEYYAEPDPVSGPLLIAPDTVERDWLRDRGEQAAQGRGGLIAGALTGFLAAAVAIGVSTLAAAFVRPQASPVIAAGGAFIDRVPPGLKNLAVEHFGQHDTAILLTGMYVAIGLTAMVIGCLARRNVAAGVAGLAAFSLAGAFVVITRPGSRASDVIPPMIGGLAGIAALLWLARASAPAGPARHAHGGRRRRAR